MIEASVARVVGGREAARARGREYGLDEARRRGEQGAARDLRVARAVEYAEKELDGLFGPKFRAKAAVPVFPALGPFRPDPKVKKP